MPTSSEAAPALGVHTQRTGPVTVVVLDRPDVRNAVDGATARALFDAFVAFEDDPVARVAVFYGAHGHFCAGWDLQHGAALAQQGHHTEQVQALAQQFDFSPSEARPLGPMGPSRLLLSKPVIAAVSGAAVAGGMELALWCDLRVMEADAYFGVYCRRFGVPLIDGGTVRLPRLVGMGHAMDLILTGRKVEAEEALRMGLANRVVPTGTALDEAMALAQQLAAFPQPTLRADRLSAYRQWDMPLPEALHQEWTGGRECLADALAGAMRFTSGIGRHGQF